MNTTLIARVLARIAGLGLAALVTVTVLGGVGQMADHQYREAMLAQASQQPAAALVVAKIEQAGL